MNPLFRIEGGERAHILNLLNVSMVSRGPGLTLNLYNSRGMTFLPCETENEFMRAYSHITTANPDWLRLYPNAGIGAPLPEGFLLVNRRKLTHVTREHDMGLLWILRFWVENGEYAVRSFPGPTGESDSRNFMYQLK